MQKNILGTEKISRLFIKFAVPAIIGMIITSLQTIIDGIFVGQYVGANALASVNIARPFMDMIFGPTFIIAIGAISIIGRALGAGKTKEAQSAFRTATLLGLGLGIFIALIGSLFHRQLAVFFGANSLLLSDVETYIRTIAVFAPLIFPMILFGFASRILGNPKVYLYGSILSVMVNISLDYCLVKEAQMGVFGAALATGIAFSTSLLVTIVPMLNRNKAINLFSGKWYSSVIGPMLYNGSSEGIVSLSAAITVFLFNRTFMHLAGANGVAAYTTISYISSFAVMSVFGISDGIGSLISYNFGQNRQDRIREIMKLAIRTSLIIGFILVILTNLYGESLIRLFIKGNPSIVTMAVMGASLYSISFLLVGYNVIYSAYFTAIGNAKASVIIALSRGMIGIAAGLMILPPLMGIHGVWLAVPFAEVITIFLAIFLKQRATRVDQIVIKSKKQRIKSA